MAAAVAGGIVGTVALSEKKTDSLIGTVAALALVPAAAAAAVAALAADLHRTLGGLLLLGMNFGLVIAMGILTLLVLRRELAATPIAAAVLITAGVVLLLALARAVGVTTGEPTSIPNYEQSDGLLSSRSRWASDHAQAECRDAPWLAVLASRPAAPQADLRNRL